MWNEHNHKLTHLGYVSCINNYYICEETMSNESICNAMHNTTLMHTRNGTNCKNNSYVHLQRIRQQTSTHKYSRYKRICDGNRCSIIWKLLRTRWLLIFVHTHIHIVRKLTTLIQIQYTTGPKGYLLQLTHNM